MNAIVYGGRGGFLQSYDVVVIDTALDGNAYEQYAGFVAFLAVKDGEVCAFDESLLLEHSSHGGECLRHFELGSGTTASHFILLQHDESSRCNIKDLLTALGWCIDNGISLINLSMGTTQYCDAGLFSDVMRRISEAGICLIAGASNVRELSYPACFTECIGVCYDYTREYVASGFAYIENPLDGIDIVLNPKVEGTEPIDSTSMATAYFSGLVVKAIGGGTANPDNVKTWIAENSERISATSLYGYTLDAIVHDVIDDIVVIGIENLSQNAAGLGFWRDLQAIFHQKEYYCLTVLPKGTVSHLDGFFRQEFVQPVSSQCSYGEYIRLIEKLCKPNVILADLDVGSIDFDVAVCKYGIHGGYDDAFVVHYEGLSPRDVFEHIESHFVGESVSP